MDHDQFWNIIETAKRQHPDDSEVSRFQIGSIPTLLIFKNGQYVARYTGFTSKNS